MYVNAYNCKPYLINVPILITSILINIHTENWSKGNIASLLNSTVVIRKDSLEANNSLLI